jgi:hypothetical protein
MKTSSTAIRMGSVRVGMAVLALCGLVTLLAGRAAADEKGSEAPQVNNARMETRTLAGPLAAELTKWTSHAVQPQWIGYSEPQIPGNREVCCSGSGSRNQGCGTCRLEDGNHGINMNTGDDSVKLEGPRAFAILFRAENRQVTKIRMVSLECTLDAGGLPFVWLTGVKPSESVASLAAFVDDKNFEQERHDGRLDHQALTAIALHADDSADHALESFARPEAREELRKQAAFWLGEARGKAGFVVLQKMAKSDPSSEVRSQVTFALSVSREPGAIDEMIRMAHDDESGHVRGQALFWLAQKAGQKAAAAITGAIDSDPDTEVKKKAVFALSQMPKEEGVPKLIEVAQTNRNPAVRKQAMFWLGQSNDPRALEFFEKVLSQ